MQRTGLLALTSLRSTGPPPSTGLRSTVYHSRSAARRKTDGGRGVRHYSPWSPWPPRPPTPPCSLSPGGSRSTPRPTPRSPPAPPASTAAPARSCPTPPRVQCREVQCSVVRFSLVFCSAVPHHPKRAPPPPALPLPPPPRHGGELLAVLQPLKRLLLLDTLWGGTVRPLL